MDAAIRDALERAGIPGAEARRRIYQSARTALDRSLERQNVADPAMVAEQHRRLDVLISAIEAEWTPPSVDDRLAKPAPPPPALPLPTSPTPASPTGAGLTAPGLFPASPASPALAAIMPVRAAESFADWRDASLPPVSAPTETIPTVSAPSGPAGALPAGRSPAPAVSLGPGSSQSLPADGVAAPRVEARRDLTPQAVPPQPVPQPVHQPSVSLPLGPTVAPAINPGPRDAARVRPARHDTEKFLPEKSGPKKSGAEKSGPNKSGRETPPRRKRPLYSSLFSGLVMLVFLGLGLVFLVKTGAIDLGDLGSAMGSSASRDVGATPASGRETRGPQQIAGGSGFSGEWSSVYSPGASEAASTRGAAEASVVNEGDRSVLRITSQSADQSGEVLVPIPADILQALAGRKSVIALTVRSTSSEATQIYVQCQFSTLGDCGRRRFDVTYQTSDILFNLDFEKTLAPNTPGHIIINSDITGQGHGIDLMAIRMRPGG